MATYIRILTDASEPVPGLIGAGEVGLIGCGRVIAGVVAGLAKARAMRATRAFAGTA